MSEISRKAALGAVRAGGEAARDGKAATDCPHSADTTEGRFLRSFWISGHAEATVAQQ